MKNFLAMHPVPMRPRPALFPALLWQIEHGRHAVGWAGALAILLALACALLQLLFLQPLQEQGLLAQRAAQALREPAPTAAGILRAPAQALPDVFPSVAALELEIGRLYQAAAQQGLRLDQGEYVLAREAAGALLRYGIALPVQGEYPRIRAFLAQAVQEMPNLGIDGITFARPAIGAATVEAQIRFSLYLREP